MISLSSIRLGRARRKLLMTLVLFVLCCQATLAMCIRVTASRCSLPSRGIDRLPAIGRGGSAMRLGLAIPAGGSDEQDGASPSDKQSEIPPSEPLQSESIPTEVVHSESAPAELLQSESTVVQPTESEASPPHVHVQLETTPPTPATEPTIASLFGPLFAMTRPANFPGVVLFHMVGVHLVLNKLGMSSTYLTTLFTRPTIGLTLIALLLTSSTSMLVNDYYDAKLGRDANKPKPLVQGTIPLAVARRFTSWLYAIALLIVTVLPGALSRVSVVIGLMLTYLYTVHFKPIPWLKNVVCAVLIGLSPLTSGSAALQVAGGMQSQIFSVGNLWRLGACLFFGIMGREMMMDCNDVENDYAVGVRTVPVVHGKAYASRAALVFTGLMAALCLGGPAVEVTRGLLGRTTSRAAIRRLVFAAAGSFAGLRQSWKVYVNKASDPQVVEHAVDQGLINVVLLLASFI